jgi:hypothetical protein
MDSKDPEYPTEEQMEECWTAWKEGGKEGLREFLRKQDPEQEMARRKVES